MKRWSPGYRAELVWGDLFVCEPDWSWRVRSLPNPDLWYVIEGRGWIEDGGRRRAIGAGDCLVLRPGGSYRAGHDPEHPLRFVATHFVLLDGEGRRLAPAARELPPFIRQMEMGAFLRELLTRAVRCHQDGRFELGCAWMQAALMEVVRQDAQTWPPGAAGDQARAIEAICKRIRRHPARPVRVEALAAELNVSAEHFCRLFRRFQGLSPRAFITRTRIEAAQMLLLKSSHSVARISELLGYESPFYFSRHFKTKVGASPSAFRRRERGPAR